LKAELKAIDDPRLEKLIALAATCPDLESFRQQLAPPRRRTSNHETGAEANGRQPSDQ
jgi:hypothetical protein